MKIDEQIRRESGVHGEQWTALHEGYFSDAIIARPLIETITRYLSAADADVIVDLGGGTGFILRELVEQGITAHRIPVNLDCSETQLEAAGKGGVSCIRGMISDFRRSDLVHNDTKRMFFIMRSVLHYFGREDLSTILQHIRRQARTGEMFVHQSACFENSRDAQCIYRVYLEMASTIWYPVTEDLRDSMTATGWDVMDITPAPPLKLSSAELGQRYGIDEQDLLRIRSRLMDEFGEMGNIFQCTRNGFVAYLQYMIFVGLAV